MSLLFEVKQGAGLPSITLTITPPAGSTVDLQTATSLEFRYRKRGEAGAVVETVPLTALTATTCRLDLTAGMVDTVGKFDCQIKAVFSGKDQYFPTAGFDKFEIGENF